MDISTNNIEQQLHTIVQWPLLQQAPYAALFQRANDLLTQLTTNEFTVVITGDIGTGKSTLINALIGQNILPTAHRQITNTITYIKNVPFTSPLLHTMDVTLVTGQQYTVHQPCTADILHYNDLAEVAYITLYMPIALTDAPIVLVDTPAYMYSESLPQYVQQADVTIYLPSLSTTLAPALLTYVQQAQDAILIALNKMDMYDTAHVHTYTENLAQQLKRLCPISTPQMFQLCTLQPFASRTRHVPMNPPAPSQLDDLQKELLTRITNWQHNAGQQFIHLVEDLALTFGERLTDIGIAPQQEILVPEDDIFACITNVPDDEQPPAQAGRSGAITGTEDNIFAYRTNIPDDEQPPAQAGGISVITDEQDIDFDALLTNQPD